MGGISTASAKAACLGAITALALGWQAAPAAAGDRPAAAPQDVGLLPGQLENLDARMHEYVDDGQVGGVVTLLARHGRIAHFDAYGWADRESGEPMRRDTVVKMFSMTKPVASVALLMLYEEGKFQLKDPLEMHIPAFADVKVLAGHDSSGNPNLEEPRRKPTMQDVLRHTAGFNYGDWGDEQITARWREGAYNNRPQADFIAALAEFPLVYHPGEKWVYSYSHDVQAHLVELFSGMAFADFVKARIFDPLDMTNSYFGEPDERPANYATLYTRGPDGLGVPQPWNEGPRYGRNVVGGSGLSSNARDYLQFAQMLLNGGELDGKRLLSPSTVEFMSMNHVPEGMQVGPTSGRGYGLGVEVVTDPALYGLPVSVGQYGWSGAATTYFSVDPAEDMVSILITQIRPMNLGIYGDFIALSKLAVAD